MIGVRSVGLYVRDQDRARTFWTETMGFELVQDVPMGEGADAPRWLEVRAPGDAVVLVLFTPEGQQDRAGTFSNVLFTCDDIRREHEELSAQGVRFAEEPRQEPWGWWASFEDPDGNTYGLGQRGD